MRDAQEISDVDCRKKFFFIRKLLQICLKLLRGIQEKFASIPPPESYPRGDRGEAHALAWHEKRTQLILTDTRGKHFTFPVKEISEKISAVRA